MTEIRKVKPNEFDQCLDISQYAFQYTLPQNEKESRIKAMEKYEIWGEFENNNLISKVNIIHFETTIANTTFSMGGVAGVATYPEKRRKGSVTRLLSHALKEMKQKGQVISYLHPFNIGFYRKYGWENASEYKVITLDNRDLKPIPLENIEEGSVVRVQREESLPLLRQVYNEVKKQYNGLLERTDEWWEKNVHPKHPHTAVYVNKQNQAMGYLIYSIKESKCEIKEFMFGSEEARTHLWNFICQHDSMVETVKIWTFIDDPIDVFLPVAKPLEVEKYGMVRIVDVLEFLKSFPFRDQLDGLTLFIEDSFCEWNTGTYTFTNGSISYRNLDQAESVDGKGLWMEIGTLSAIMVNYRLPSFFHSVGKLKGTVGDVKRFEQALPDQIAAVIDFF